VSSSLISLGLGSPASVETFLLEGLEAGASASGAITIVSNPDLRPARVWLHDAHGTRIGQITSATAVGRLYQSNQAAQLTFTLDPAEGAVVNFDELEGGSVVIESDFYPLTWVGELQYVRTDHEAGTEQWTVLAKEGLLWQRKLGASFTASGTAGAILRRILQEVEATNPVGIAIVPELIEAGPATAVRYDDFYAGDAIARLARDTGMEFWVEHTADERGIFSIARFAARRGFDRTGEVTLTAGRRPNIRLLESGKNLGASRPQSITVVGRSGRGAASLGSGSARVLFDNTVTTTAAAEVAAAAILARPRLASRMFRFEVLEDYAVWQHMTPGNRVRLQIPGYDEVVRIVNAQPEEENGVLRTVVEEWSDA